MIEAVADKEKSKVLIVDDQPLVREILNSLLADQGYQLDFACDGYEALTKAAELRPDLIILDVMMPGIDGIEVCRRLREDVVLAETAIIMITALDDKETRLRGFEAGVDDFLTKPFNASELLVRARSITRFSRHRRLRTLELQAERDRTQAILEALGDAVVVIDVHGLIGYLNPAAVALTQYTAEEAQGQSWRLWESDQTDPTLYNKIFKTAREGQTWRGEVVNRRQDGSLYDAALTVAPLFASDQTGNLVGFVSVQRDITPLKKAEQAKNEFVSNVSHELRTPLAILMLLGDNLNALYDRLNDQQRLKMIGDIRKNTQIFDELIGDVLEMSRIDSGRLSSVHEPLDLVDLVRGEVADLLALAQEKFQVLQVNSQSQVLIEGNEGQLRQIIRNLISNAIKYTPDYGQIACNCRSIERATLRAWLGADQSLVIRPAEPDLSPARWAVLQVIDSGIGVDPPSLPHLFERFYRVRSQGNIRGTGLGLSIVLELVEHYAGFMSVISKPALGSTFSVYLPLITKD